MKINKILSIINLFIIFTLCQSTEMIGQISEVNGNCFIKNNRVHLQFKEALIGRSIYSDDIIKVKDNSYCTVLYSDNKTQVEIGPNSSVQFFDNQFAREIKISRGQLFIENVHNADKKTYLFTPNNQIFVDHNRMWVYSEYSKGDLILSINASIDLYNSYTDFASLILPRKLYSIDNMGNIVEESNIDLIPKHIEDKIEDDFSFSYEMTLKKDDLIPIYGKRIYNEEIPYSFSFGLGSNSIIDTNYIKLGVYPNYRYKNLFLAAKVETHLNPDGNNLSSEWDDFYDVFDKVSASYQYSNNNNELFFTFGQNISNVQFGQGYLFKNITRSIENPKMKTSGFYLRYKFDEDFMDFDMVIPSLRDFSDSGGLIALRTSLFISHKFPLTLGLGMVSDFNQFSSLNDRFDNRRIKKKRDVFAVEFDFDYKIISRLDKDISIFSEFVGIWYPDYTYYVLSDDSKLSDDLRWRKGVWGIKGPGVALKFNNRYEMKFSFNYNSATFIPNYFNSTYFYNRVRYYRDDDISYPLVIKQINMIEDNFSVSGNNDEYFIPKDIFPTLLGNDGFSAYPVFGFTTEHSYHIYKYVDVSLSAAMFVEDSDQAKQYYSFETSIEINDKYIKRLSFLNVYFSNTFFENFLDEDRMILGLDAGIEMPFRLTLIINLAQVYYDSNLLGDNSLDPVKNFGMSIKYNFEN